MAHSISLKQNSRLLEAIVERVLKR